MSSKTETKPRLSAGSWRHRRYWLVALLICFFAFGWWWTGVDEHRWSENEAQAWYVEHGPLHGVNYVPSNRVNTTDWWQSPVDEDLVARELGWAAELGFNAVRVFLQFIVWQDDSEALLDRFEQFVSIADEQGLRVVPVLFDDCAFGEPKQLDPYLGPQRPPQPHVLLSSWTPSPGKSIRKDPAYQPQLRNYVADVVGRYRADPRIVFWDLYNEPGHNGGLDYSAELLRLAFVEARRQQPIQPITVAVWDHWDEAAEGFNEYLFAASDILSIHLYGDLEFLQEKLVPLQASTDRPIIVSEWMGRWSGSDPVRDLTWMVEAGIGTFAWGLVSGDTQGRYPWWSNAEEPTDPNFWHHDFFHRDGRPFNPEETDGIRELLLNP